MGLMNTMMEGLHIMEIMPKMMMQMMGGGGDEMGTMCDMSSMMGDDSFSFGVDRAGDRYRKEVEKKLDILVVHKSLRFG